MPGGVKRNKLALPKGRGTRASFEPGDEQVGTWPRERLVQMDLDFSDNAPAHHRAGRGARACALYARPRRRHDRRPAAEIAPDVLWFQLYRCFRNEHAVGFDLVRRAEAMGVHVLVLAADVPVRTTRPREVEVGITSPFRPSAHRPYPVRWLDGQRRCWRSVS